MVSKHELSLSTNYVPDWGIVEAFRELFQNALDNEILNPENKMSWNYENDTITICSKTSKLLAESMLLGGGTKATDDRTIGKHGEGYKIAFMVLLRNNKKVKVYNYGMREIWDVKLVNSKKYNGQKITTIFVEKEASWKKVPNNDLIIEVSGITEDEYKEIVDKNLNLRLDSIKTFDVPNSGKIILNENEAGNIYVKGLFVTKNSRMHYGYDFEPQVLGLDRDRKVVDSFNISWEASALWNIASGKDSEMCNKAIELVDKNALDTGYVEKTCYLDSSIIDGVADKFFEYNGKNAVPVTNNLEYNAIIEKSKETGNEIKPVIVQERTADIIRKSPKVAKELGNELDVVTLKDKFLAFLDLIEDRLEDEELETFRELIDDIKS